MAPIGRTIRTTTLAYASSVVHMRIFTPRPLSFLFVSLALVATFLVARAEPIPVHLKTNQKHLGVPNTGVALLQRRSDPLLGTPGARPFAHVSPSSFGGSLADNGVSMSDGSSKQGGAPTSLKGTGQNGAQKPRVAFEINRPTRVLPEKQHLTSCSVTVAEHSFGNSYGKPFIAQYSPDMLNEDCRDPSRWVFIEMVVKGKGKGRQFDRLASVQLDGIEVLRTDNQEPSVDGSVWTFTKEMNKYYDVFRTGRTLVFDLPNIVNDIYVSPLDYTLTFTAYVPASGQASPLPPLSKQYPIVLPLSKKSVSENSFFNIGEASDDTGITSLTFPRNTRAALVEIYASGTAGDEFWYTNLPDTAFTQDKGQAGDYANPRGPLRELQVLIDGKLAGIAQPFAVIFTGGISPFFWRPQVAYGAFDQPTYYIDISPFIGTLTDDKPHEVRLDVVSAERNQSVLSWFVSGNVQVMLDPSEERTTGEMTVYDAPRAGEFTNAAVVSGNVSTDGSIAAHTGTTGAGRTIYIEGTLRPGSSAEALTVSWQQHLTFANKNTIQGETSTTQQEARGSSTSRHGSETFLASRFDFALHLTSQGPVYTLHNTFKQRFAFRSSNSSATYKEPASQTIDMVQHGTARNIYNGTALAGGVGKTRTTYDYEDSDGMSFSRTNAVHNQTLVLDEVSGALAGKAGPVQ